MPSDFVADSNHAAKTPEVQLEVKERFGNIDYQAAIGALIYLSCGTRPNITWGVSKLAKFTNYPNIQHYCALLWMLGYISNTACRGIRFYADAKNSPCEKLLAKQDPKHIPDTHLFHFTDASWNDCPDTGRSTCGRMTFYMGGIIDHGTHVPVPVAMSSGEAEYLGAGTAAMSAAHFRMLHYDFENLGKEEYSLQAMDETRPSTIFLDNTATIQMAQINRDTNRTRHISRRIHYVRQGVAKKQHKLIWIPTRYQLADILTKVPSAAKFKPLWDIILVEINDLDDITGKAPGKEKH
jgi:hypothetical protein